ncbi:angiomotin [Ditylenchus destructor]|uniref:Angiomotin n=1 Tax=Ditylenchus destructor TaxID=166010 RepID=A0AAD4MWV0_9BILA|nr:angiomotin [Ditylenchus destructor]
MIENYRNHVLKHQKLSPKLQQHKHFAATNNFQNSVYNPPSMNNNSVALMSHSQPCLFPVSDQRSNMTSDCTHYQHSSDTRDEINQPITQPVSKAINNSNEVVLLRNENGFLKQQVEILQKKTDKLQQLEHAFLQLHQDFEQVTTQRDKQEQLEKMAVLKLEQRLQSLSQENENLQRESARLQLFVEQHSQLSDAEQQVVQLNMFLNDLIAKNKEMSAMQEQQKVEIDAQSATLEEQRTHIDMLEKALNNAQERLAAKERQAVDAVAIVDKCSHLQKLLQDAIDDKQKRQEEYNRQKAQFEMEMTQLKMQLAKDGSNSFGHIKGAKSSEIEEIAKLKKTIFAKDERISQLENNFLETQKRYNGELQRNDQSHRGDSDEMLAKIRNLEQEKVERERRIQELLDEKQRIHNQWADERRSLDHRVRLLEQDLRHLMGSNSTISLIGYPSYYPSSMNSPYSSAIRQRSSAELPTSARAAVLDDSTMARMEELRRKIADRRANSSLPAPNALRNSFRHGEAIKPDSRKSSASSLIEHSRTNSGPSNSALNLSQMAMNHRNSDNSSDHSAGHSRSSSAHMPEHLSNCIEYFPDVMKRRLAAAEKLSAAPPPPHTASYRTNAVINRPYSRRLVRDHSVETSRTTSDRSSSRSSIGGREPTALAPGTTRVELQGPTVEQKTKGVSAISNPPAYFQSREMFHTSQKPPTGNSYETSIGNSSSSAPTSRQTTTVVEVNKDHLVVTRREDNQDTQKDVKQRRSSLGSFPEKI